MFPQIEWMWGDWEVVEWIAGATNRHIEVNMMVCDMRELIMI